MPQRKPAIACHWRCADVRIAPGKLRFYHPPELAGTRQIVQRTLGALAAADRIGLCLTLNNSLRTCART